LPVLFLTYIHWPGYVSECSDVLILILVSVYQILAGC